MRIDTQSIATALKVAEAVKPRLAGLRKASQDFEAIFLKKLFSTMREGVKHVTFGKTFGQDVYNDMFDQALAESAAKTSSFGISQMMYKSFAPKVIAMEELRLRQEAALSKKAPTLTTISPTQGATPPTKPADAHQPALTPSKNHLP